MATYYSNQKLVYVRKNTAIGDDDKFTDGGAYSPNDIVGFVPESTTQLLVHLKARINQGTDYQANNYINTDSITLLTSSTSNDKRDVIKAIVTAINDPSGSPLIVLGDDTTGEYIHPFISDTGVSISDQIT